MDRWVSLTKPTAGTVFRLRLRFLGNFPKIKVNELGYDFVGSPVLWSTYWKKTHTWNSRAKRFLGKRKSKKAPLFEYGIALISELSSISFLCHALKIQLQTFVALLFSYVRDATAAMIIAFSLFVFPSKRPRIYAPDGSGMFTITSPVKASSSSLAESNLSWIVPL